ncbi:hypothetical protein CEY15_15030 [Dietzia natronolimnaea]|uniref:DUF3375 domain-containing protein n=1 Tax=Dietzia natronolimnaea TaxID=161920 RepID=A0A2A2WLV7_9ACTN|nr:DUF3375 domain-containing protein [Dietzia natronolimnaea]PAY22177.1 hypothetical protein CEY15_15030 [Dietzia natronolimnaea]
MDYAAIDALRERHPAWRMLRATHAPLLLSFLGRFFVEEGHGASPEGEIIDALDDELYLRNGEDPENPRFKRDAADYLAEWASTDSGFLRRFYPLGTDEIHYDATPALEKAYSWVQSLHARPFVGTESRLQTAIELLRQIAQGTEVDPEIRLAELQRRKQEIEREIEQIEADPEAGLLDITAVRDRYQQFSSTARELLADFREVEENFRALDRSARERIATWEGSKGDLLEELVSGRSRIDSSDQGRSFQAFYDMLLSSSGQEELSALLERLTTIDELKADRSIRTVHHGWAEAAERTQLTVRQISEQLRRFTDDQIWLENRRVLDLVREIEGTALALRTGAPPEFGLELEQAGVDVSLPTERPLHSVRPASEVDSLLPPAEQEDVDTSVLADQVIVDPARLAARLRNLVPERGTALLEDVVTMYPVEHGAAELVGYLALDTDDIEVTTDEQEETVIEYDEAGRSMRARMPRVVVRRR